MNLELWDEKGTEFAPLSDDMLVYRGNSLVIGDRTFEHEGGCTVKLLKEAIEKSKMYRRQGQRCYDLGHVILEGLDKVGDGEYVTCWGS